MVRGVLVVRWPQETLDVLGDLAKRCPGGRCLPSVLSLRGNPEIQVNRRHQWRDVLVLREVQLNLLVLCLL